MSITTTVNGRRLLCCADCTKVVATVQIPDEAIIRAVILCPECYAEAVMMDSLVEIREIVSNQLRHKEVQVRHDIAQDAPPCEHTLNEEKEHKAYCGFINRIWQSWGAENGSDYTVSVKALGKDYYTKAKCPSK